MDAAAPTAVVWNAIADFGSVCLQSMATGPDGSSNAPMTPMSTFSPQNTAIRPLVNAPFNGLLRLTLSSSDAHLISIQKKVALGHYSDIYQGIYAPTRLKLALKRPRILEGTTQAKEVERRYKREAEIWSSLYHVNILPFYGIVELSSIAYLVAPWVEQGDLSKFLDARLEYLRRPSFIQSSIPNQQFTPFVAFDEAATIHGIASGLSYLHARGVIHGDVKAANIFLTDSLTPLLGDFGLTKSDEFRMTSPGLKGGGTARWKSPGLINEQARTSKTDIYALGMTIVEILTGQAPFPNVGSSSKVSLVVSQGYRPPFEPTSRRGKDFWPLWKLAAACWRHTPGDRPTAAEVMERVTHFLLTVPPRCIGMNSHQSSDIWPVRLQELDEPNNTLHELRSTPFSTGCIEGRTMEEHEDLTSTQRHRNIENDNGIGTDTGSGNNDRRERYDNAGTSLGKAAVIFNELGDQRIVADSATAKTPLDVAGLKSSASRSH
ncbi:hypothetical protein FRB95_012575 [Tulasnella sp. JGI-2019a]|nr:hypothetical protein FRB95_012575 [Tulasnella sp. JGI-2019a]